MFMYCIYFIFHCITFNLDEGKSGINLELIIVSVFNSSLIQGWKLHQNLTVKKPVYLTYFLVCCKVIRRK